MKYTYNAVKTRFVSLICDRARPSYKLYAVCPSVRPSVTLTQTNGCVKFSPLVAHALILWDQILYRKSQGDMPCDGYKRDCCRFL